MSGYEIKGEVHTGKARIDASIEERNHNSIGNKI
jgi:hypothetical protein